MSSPATECIRPSVPGRLLTAGTLIALLVSSACGAKRVGRMTTLDTLAGPHFAFGRHELSPEGRAKVRAAAQTLNQHPTRGVQVNGFTDSFGSEDTNLRLSARRADTVRSHLIEDGVAANRITVHGYGAANPVASNATAEGRAQNRRVEILLE